MIKSGMFYIIHGCDYMSQYVALNCNHCVNINSLEMGVGAELRGGAVDI